MGEGEIPRFEDQEVEDPVEGWVLHFSVNRKEGWALQCPVNSPQIFISLNLIPQRILPLEIEPRERRLPAARCFHASTVLRFCGLQWAHSFKVTDFRFITAPCGILVALTESV